MYSFIVYPQGNGGTDRCVCVCCGAGECVCVAAVLLLALYVCAWVGLFVCGTACVCIVCKCEYVCLPLSIHLCYSMRGHAIQWHVISDSRDNVISGGRESGLGIPRFL